MAPYFRLFGFTVQAYGLLILAAVWVGLDVSARQARRLGLNGNQVYNLTWSSTLWQQRCWARGWSTS